MYSLSYQWQGISGWEMISSIVGSLGFLILVIGVPLTCWQLRLNRKQNQLSAFNSMLEQWGTDEGREQRRFVMQRLKYYKTNGLPDGLQRLEKEARKKVEAVLARFDRISFMTDKNLVPKAYVIELIGLPMLRCYDEAKWFIDMRRKETRDNSYVLPFENFINNNRDLIQKNKFSGSNPIK